MKKFYSILGTVLMAWMFVPSTAKADDCRFTPDMFPGQTSDRTELEVSVTVSVGSFGKCPNTVSNVVDLYSTNNDVIYTSGGANNYYAVLAIHPGTAKVTYTEVVTTTVAGEDGALFTNSCATNHTINYTVVKGTPIAQFVDGNTPITEYRVVQNAGFNAPYAQVITKAIKNASTYPEFRDVTIDPTQMTFTSSNPNVATIGRSNVVTLTNQVGETTITATWAGDSNWEPVTISYKLIVEAETPITPTCPDARFFSNGAEITSLTVKQGEAISIPMLLGATGTILPTGNCRMESERIAMITEDGMIYGVTAGSTVLHVFIASTDGMVCEYPLNIVVEAAAPQKQDPELSFDKAEINVELGETFVRPTLVNPHNIELTPANSKWYTNWNSPVAEVNEQTGEVIIKGVGDETITFEFTGSDTYNFAIISYSIHVTTTGLVVGGVTVTNSNKNDVLGDNGSIVYDPVTHTLTMTNAVVNGTNMDLAPARSRTAQAEAIDAAIRYTGRETLTIVLIGSNAILNADAGIYADYAAVVIMSATDGNGTALFSGNTVAIKAAALKLYQCNITASGGVGVAVNELGVARGAHLVAYGKGLAIQANNLVMAEDNNGEGIGILTAGVTFKPKQGFYNADGSMATVVEIGKVAVPVPDDEITTLDFSVTDPEGNESVIFSSSAQDKYNEETGEIELSSTLTDEQVESAIQTFFPGSSEWRESLPGTITFDIPAGQGTITIVGSISYGYTLKLKMGDQPVVTVKKGETGEIVILYDTPATIHVVLYLQLDGSASAPDRIARAAAEEPTIGATISSITITPKQAIPTTTESNEEYINRTGKFLRNGQLLIIRDGKLFNAQGAEVK